MTSKYTTINGIKYDIVKLNKNIKNPPSMILRKDEDNEFYFWKNEISLVLNKTRLTLRDDVLYFVNDNAILVNLDWNRISNNGNAKEYEEYIRQLKEY
jgi:hypothetical protein